MADQLLAATSRANLMSLRIHIAVAIKVPADETLLEGLGGGIGDGAYSLLV